MSDAVERLNAALEGRYEVEREIGEGGMATVYLARDLRHNRNVALKVLKPDLAAVVGADRFLAEIETTANLQHPHILPLFDSGEADSFLFYVMPFVEGETLRERIDREKQLPVTDAVEITSAVAKALQHAHDRGVVHRDIKPGNILLQDGQPVVSDFGIALAVGSAGGARLTETGLSLGTPYYMSPEQATGDQAVGPAADIYALGAVLYEMLVGDPPYMGSTAQAVLGKIIQGVAVSATGVRSSVPANVDAAVRKALEKLPADRFRDAGEFTSALTDGAFRHGLPAGSAPAGARTRNLFSLAMAAIAVVALGVAGYVSFLPDPAPEVSRFEIVPGPGQALLPVNTGVAYALSHDGRNLVYVGEASGGRQQLWLRRMDNLEASPIPGTEGADNPVLSPDGSSVAFRVAGQPRVVLARLDGGPPTTLLEGNVTSSYIDWTDDDFIYFTGPDPLRIFRIPAVGGEPEPVTQRVEGVGRVILPDVLPNDRGILVTLRRSNLNDATIGVAGPDGEVVELFPGVSARYASTGQIVYATAQNQLTAVPFDIDELEVTGPHVPLVAGIAIRVPGLGAQFAMSENGTLVYRPGVTGSAGEVELTWLDRSGVAEPVEEGWTFQGGGDARGWSLSSDGTRIALLRTTDGNQDIWIKDLPNGPLSRLTFDEARDTRPMWAPDGQSVTFSSQRDGTWRLLRKRADGVGEVESLFDFDGFMGSGGGGFSPDSSWAVIRTAGGVPGVTRQIYGLRFGVDTEPVPLVTGSFNAVTPVISPDGSFIAYASDQTGAYEVFVRPFPDVDAGRWQVSTSGGISPFWSKSGDELFFMDGARNMTVATVEVTPTFRAVRLDSLFTLSPDYLVVFNEHGFDITPDGQRILAGRGVGAEGTTSDPRIVLVQNFFEELRERLPN